MKLHTNLTADQVRQLAADLIPGITVRIEEHGSRSHERRLDFHPLDNGTLTVKGRRVGQSGLRGITWDEWGIILNALFDADPDMKATYYESASDFHYVTGTRFADLTWEEQHGRHRWEFKAADLHECECGASRRHIPAGGFAA